MGQNFKKSVWSTDKFSNLDSKTKYCLVDTMVVLPIHQGDPDVTADVKRELHNATLILLKRIVGEATHKHDEIKDNNEITDIKDFTALLVSRLKSVDIRFQLVQLEPGMPALVQKMCNDRPHGGLSVVDYTLLFVAKMYPDMDVMTEDKHLIGTIKSERGSKAKGVIRHTMLNYNKRREDTAGFIRRKLGKYVTKDIYVEWHDRLQYTEFLIKDVRMISINYSLERNAQVVLSPEVKKYVKDLKSQSELETQIQKFFSQWKPKADKEIPAQKKDRYAQHLNDSDDLNGLDKNERKKLARQMKKRNVDLDI